MLVELKNKTRTMIVKIDEPIWLQSMWRGSSLTIGGPPSRKLNSTAGNWFGWLTHNSCPVALSILYIWIYYESLINEYLYNRESSHLGNHRKLELLFATTNCGKTTKFFINYKRDRPSFPSSWKNFGTIWYLFFIRYVEVINRTRKFS